MDPETKENVKDETAKVTTTPVTENVAAGAEEVKTAGEPAVQTGEAAKQDVKDLKQLHRHHFYVDKNTVEHFVALTTARSMAVKERLNQKGEKLIDSIPVLRTIYHKIDNWDKRMAEKHGQVYTKIRKSVINVARTVLAAQMFGLPGIVGICTYKVCESAAAFLEPAEKARQQGKVHGIFDYLKKNKEEAAVSTTNSALTVAATACEMTGAVGVEELVRTGKASLLMGSEMKLLGKTVLKWIQGKASFKDVKRDAVVAGITFATYFASDAPMTRGGAIKEEDPKDKVTLKDTAKTLKDKTAAALHIKAKQAGR